MVISHSDVLLLVHLVWSTAGRVRVLRPADDAWLASSIRSSCIRRSCELLAIGNSDDHVHVLVSLHPATSVAEVAQQMKGFSSHAWNAGGDRVALRWQNGYWARTVDQDALAGMSNYVAAQRVRHASGNTRADWEQHVPGPQA